MKQTTRSLLGVLALLLVALAIAFAAAWAGRDEEKKTEAKEKNEKLFDFDKARAHGLRIAKPGSPALVLARADEKTPWKMTEPVQADGDDAAVSGLLESLVTLKQKKDLGDERDAKQYGLDHPQLTIAVKLDDGKEVGLELGIDNPFDSTIYARKLGDPVIRALDGWHKQGFDKSAFDLRNKKVAHLDDSAEVRRVDVSAVRTPYVLEKDGAAWKVSGGLADAAAAERIANSLKNLRATAVAAESAPLPGQFGLDLPKAIVRIGVGADPVVRTVVFGQPAPAQGSVTVKTYAKSDDSAAVFEVDNEILKDLDKDPAELQDKQLVHADREDVRKLVFEGPAGKVEVARTKPAQADGGVGEEQFAVVAPQAGPAKKWKLSSALYSLTALHASSFEGPVPKDLAKFGLDKPKTVTLLGEGGTALARVQVGAEKDGKRYVLVDGVPKLARVEKGAVDDLPWTAADALETPPK